MPIGDNAKKGPRGAYDNVKLPKDELMKILEEQRSKSSAAIDRVNIRLREFYERSEERDRQRRIDKKKDKTKTRARNKNDFYD